ncbi:pentatricopeptide repeat-containing protein At5g16860-like [Gossypium arboreum]|uniref:pentatricopeptide repeat-containing protein At5g16860-like n=1 Tax=Gossypium arboreum TaxID=29729 RepID=UPI00081970ED|nr:pentatricopeptide repeat-containing protein At5g16860-like [Gossypium arboreum]
MIVVYTQHGYPSEALDLCNSLLRTDLKPNEAIITSILSACADLGSLSIRNEIELYVINRIDKAEVLGGVLYKDLAVWIPSHSRLVEDGLKYFKSMKDNFGIKPGIEHYTCLVDLLGRVGHFNLALKIENHPRDAYASTSSSLGSIA